MESAKVRDNLADSSHIMAECEWIILCDYAFPALHGKLCIIGVFDSIFAPQVPVQHPRASIGYNIIGEPGEHVQMKMEIIGPTGVVMLQAVQEFTLPDAGSAFGYVELQDLQLKDFGRHAIQMDFGNGTPKSAWFTLKQAPA